MFEWSTSNLCASLDTEEMRMCSHPFVLWYWDSYCSLVYVLTTPASLPDWQPPQTWAN